MRRAGPQHVTARQAALFAGAAEFLQQPIEPAVLVEVVRSHLPAST